MKTERKSEVRGKPFAGSSGEGGDSMDDEDDYADAVNRHAKYIGIDPEEDVDYMWIAEEALNAEVPRGWITGEGEGEYEGLVYYYNEATGQSTWDHPLDEYYRKLFKKWKSKDDSERSKHKTGKRTRQSTQSRTSPSSSRANRDTRKQRLSHDRDSSRRRSKSPCPRQGEKTSRRSEKGRVGDQATKLKEHNSAYSSSRTKKVSTEKSQRDERKKFSRGQRRGESGDTGRKLISKELRCRYGPDSPHAQENRDKASRKGLNSPEHPSPAAASTSANEKKIDDILHSVLSSRSIRSVGDDGVPQGRKGGYSSRKRGVQDSTKTRRQGESRECTRDFEREPSELLELSLASTAQKGGISISSFARASPPGTRSREGKLHRSRRADEVGTPTNSDQREGHTKRPSPLKVKRERLKTRSDHGSSSHSLSDELLDLSVSEETTVGNDGYHTGSRAKKSQLVKASDSGEAVLPIGDMDLNKKEDHRTIVMSTGGDGQKVGSFLTTERGTNKKKNMIAAQEKEEDKGREVAIWEHVDVEEVDFEAELQEIESDKEGENHLQNATKNAMSIADGGKNRKVDTLVVCPKPAKPVEMNKISSDFREDGRREGVYSKECRSNAIGETSESPRDPPTLGNEGHDAVTGCSSARHNRASLFVGGEKSQEEWLDISRGREDTRRYDRPLTEQSAPPQTRMKIDEENGDWPGVTEAQDESVSSSHRPRLELKDRPTSIGTDVDHRTCNVEGKGIKRFMDKGFVRNEKYHNDSNWSGDWDHDSHRGAGEEGKRGPRGVSMVSTSRGDRDFYHHSGGTGYFEEDWANIVDDQRCPEGKVDGEHYDGEIEKGRGRGQNCRDDWKSSQGETSAGQKKKQQQQEEEAAARSRIILEEKISSLEGELVLSKSREDNLREEVAEFPRRETALRKLHSEALKEEKGRTAEAEKKLANTISKMSQMVEMETSLKETEARLRGEVDFYQAKAKTAEDSFARREVEDKDSNVTSLRARLANAEAVLKAQSETLHEFQRQYAEASTKVTASVSEANASRDLIEKLRLEIAESTAREAALEAALTQAAREASTLSNELSRVREEVVRKDEKVSKAMEEAHGTRKELTLAMDRANQMEVRSVEKDRLIREKTLYDSMMEDLRARATGLEIANVSIERELRHAQQDALSRLREVESGRDTALYEARRAAERRSAAEAWRLKELHRAETAEAAAAMSGAEVVELRSELTRLRGAMDAAVLPHLKRQAELQDQFEDAERERAKLVAEYEREKASHATEMASIKNEIASRLPQLADKALAEAEQHWRLEAEGQISTAKQAMCRRLREMQASLEETEAKRHADITDARAETERFRNAAEKLATENRSIRGELERTLASSKAQSPFAVGWTQEPAHLASIRGAAWRSRKDDNDYGITAAGTVVENVLQTQVLGQVNAHINSLRSLLDPLSGKTFHGADQLDKLGLIKSGVDLRHGVSDGNKARFKPASPLASSRQNQSSRHLPGGSTKEEGLTEEENMRLDRLLRAVKVSPKNPKKKTEEDASTANRGNQSIDHVKGGDSPTRSRNNTVGSERDITCKHGFAVEDSSFDQEQTLQIPSNLSRTLSSSPEEGSRNVRDVSSYENVTNMECSTYSGSRLQGDVSTLRTKKGSGKDNLEDISDGGFHSGCWRRKYASGEIR